MPAEGVSMHKIKDILRLSFEAGLSQHQIAASLQLSSGVVNKYLSLAKIAQISWPLPEEIDEVKLRDLLRPHTKKENRYNEPDYASIHQELKVKGVTLLLLWQEYEQTQGKYAYRYAQYCAKYKEWHSRQKPSMRQVHRAGEKLFIDYSGPTVDIIDPQTGEIIAVQIFVAVLGASNYTFAEATLDQTLPNWIASHVRALQFFGGVPALLVPDNLKAAVSKACRYDPKVNSTYADMAAYYGTAVLPTRPYKPKDKAKVENAVLVVQRWILAKLRHQTFVGLTELNLAISKLLKELNQKPFKKLPGSRQSQFEALDKPALKPLPSRPYEFAEFKKVRVHIDYHVEVDKHYYSVPHALVKQEITARLTTTTVECFYQGTRVASHVRNYRKGAHTTLPEHMPVAHQKYLNWTPGRFLNWALEIGPATRDLVQHLLNHKAHPEQSYRTCLGLLALAKRYTNARLEAACCRALAIRALTRGSVASILEKGLDQQPLPEKIMTPLQSADSRKREYHENIRGSDYYQLLAESHLLN
jgi:transposase